MGTDWKPRKRGRVYCSPACGRGCTVAEHKKATNAAARLVKRLGSAWKARIWENLGWHYELVLGTVRLYEYWTLAGGRRVREYSASAFNSSEYHVERSTPEAALETLELMLHNGANELRYTAHRIKRARP